MDADWNDIDRRLMGHAWVGSEIAAHVRRLCDDVGVRWAGSQGERLAADYVAGQFRGDELSRPKVEEFGLQTWEHGRSSIMVAGGSGVSLDVRPCLFCPAVDVTAPLVDVGWGMPHELDALPADRLHGAIVLVDAGFEPFSEPRTFPVRLKDLAAAGVRAAITPATVGGRQTADFSASDWRDNPPCAVPLPVVQTSREDGAQLRRCLSKGTTVTVRVDATFLSRTSWNVVGDLTGNVWPEETLLLGAHHDTTTDSVGANDNGAGVAVLLETARLLALVTRETGMRPARTIRFVSFGAEEQGLQGSAAFVARHYGPEPKPRLMINLDELATGSMKGVVLQFPELRPFVQRELDTMNEGLACHVLSQLDASGDMFPFARAGIPSAILWRWRFVGRHPDTALGHTAADTPDKLRIRPLKEYAGFLARLLLRLSLVPPKEWPENRLDVGEIGRRLEAERGTVFRTM